MDTVFCLYLVMEIRVLLYVKIVKKQLVLQSGKVWFDNALHDPLDLASVLKWVTLLPLVQQGPTNGLTGGISTLSSIVPHWDSESGLLLPSWGWFWVDLLIFFPHKVSDLPIPLYRTSVCHTR